MKLNKINLIECVTWINSVCNTNYLVGKIGREYVIHLDAEAIVRGTLRECYMFCLGYMSSFNDRDSYED